MGLQRASGEPILGGFICCCDHRSRHAATVPTNRRSNEGSLLLVDSEFIF